MAKCFSSLPLPELVSRNVNRNRLPIFSWLKISEPMEAQDIRTNGDSRHQYQWRLKTSEPMEAQNIRTNGGSWGLIKLMIPTHTDNNAKYIWLTLWMGHTNNPEVPWHSGSGDGMEKKKMDYQGTKWPSTEAYPLLFSQTWTINTVTDLLLTSEDFPADTSSCRYLPKWTNIHLFPFWSLDFDTVNLMRTDRDEKCWHALPLALSTIKKTIPGYCRGSKTLIVHIHLAWMTAHPLRRTVDCTEPLKCLAYFGRTAQGQWTEHI